MRLVTRLALLTLAFLAGLLASSAQHARELEHVSAAHVADLRRANDGLPWVAEDDVLGAGWGVGR